jgi:hypothetical protein
MLGGTLGLHLAARRKSAAFVKRPRSESRRVPRSRTKLRWPETLRGFVLERKQRALRVPQMRVHGRRRGARQVGRDEHPCKCNKTHDF